MNARMTPTSKADYDRYRRYLTTEWEAANLYRSLADAESSRERAGILRELARMEDNHAARWRGRLEAAGEPLPQWSPSVRSRLLAKLAKVFGTKAVLPILEWAESGDADMYAQEPGAEDISAQEKSHERVLAGLTERRSVAPFRMGRRETRHRGAGGGTLRAAIFGVNDGLVSNLSLIMGVAGAYPGAHAVVVAGVAGLLAGAFSMATGEYVSMSTQRELFERELEMERAELEDNPAEEMQELALIYQAKGLSRDEAESISRRLMSNPISALDTLAKEELGLDPAELGSPIGAAVSSFLSFGVGAFIPLVPLLFTTGTTAVIASGLLSGLALIVVGTSSALLTGRSVVMSVARMLGLGVAAATLTHMIGRLLGVTIAG